MNIRDFLFKILFPDYYGHYNFLKYCESTRSDIKQPKNIIKYEDRYKKVFEAIQRDKVDILAIEKNKADEWVIVTKTVTDSSLWIKLYSPTYLAANNHPRIMSTLYDNYYPEKKYIAIDDVLMVDDNLGNGSICMKYFIQEAQSMGYDYIKGSLSSVDKGHFDRSTHYYKKFNFDVKLNEEKSSGSIRLNLKSEESLHEQQE